MRAGTTRKYVGAAVALAAVALAWLFLAPSNLGGSTAYVVITGNSMEPLLHADDLALVRERDHYEVGDVAAYESDKVGQLVLHRIVEQQGDRFVFQGDNNDFLDPEKPTEAGVSGELWVHIPRAGAIFRLARTPVGIAIGAVIILFMLGLFSSKKRTARSGRHSARSRGTTTPAASGPSSPIATRRPQGGPPPPPYLGHEDAPAPSFEAPNPRARRATQAVASLAGAAVLVFGLLGAAAAARPATIAVTDDVSFEHSGTFSYTAPALDSPAYDGPNVTTGEPVFLKVIDELTVTFDYRFVSESPYDVTAAGSMTARLGAGNGLRRTIELPNSAAEGDDELTLSTVLDLEEIASLVRAVQKETGIDQSAYTLTIAPEIEVTGSVVGEELDETFAPELVLEFDGLQIQTSSQEEGEPDPALTPAAPGSVTVVSQRPNPITLLNRTVSIATAERVALFGGGAALLVLIGALVVLLLSRPKNEPARIEARYGSSLIPVSEAPLHADAVEVSDFPTLMRLAEQFEQAVLHQRAAAGVHTYMIPHDGILYRYRASETRPVTAAMRSRGPRVQTRGASRRGTRSSPPEPPPRSDKEHV